MGGRVRGPLVLWSPHTRNPAVPILPPGHAPGTLAVDLWQVAVWAGCPAGPARQHGTWVADELVSEGAGGGGW